MSRPATNRHDHGDATAAHWRAVEESSRRARESITEAIGVLEALTRMCEARAAANDNARDVG